MAALNLTTDSRFLSEALGTGAYTLKCLYLGSRDGFTYEKLSDRCKDASPAFIFVRTEKGIRFGAFTSVALVSEGPKWIGDQKAFIVSLTHRTKHRVIPEKSDKALLHLGPMQASDWLALFGEGRDLAIASEGGLSQANLGFGYELPLGLEYRSNESKTYLGGEISFKVVEVEVYQVFFRDYFETRELM